MNYKTLIFGLLIVAILGCLSVISQGAIPIHTCTPGDMDCGPNYETIVKCNEQGSGYTILIEDCKEQMKVCRYDNNNEPYCKIQEGSTPNEISWMGIAIVMLLIIVVILLFLLLKKRSKSKNTFEK